MRKGKQARQAPKHSASTSTSTSTSASIIHPSWIRNGRVSVVSGVSASRSAVSRTTSHQLCRSSSKFSCTAFCQRNHSTLLQISAPLALALFFHFPPSPSHSRIPFSPSPYFITYQQTRDRLPRNLLVFIYFVYFVHTGEPAVQYTVHTTPHQRYLTIHIHSAVVRRCTRKPPKTQKLDTQSVIYFFRHSASSTIGHRETAAAATLAFTSCRFPRRRPLVFPHPPTVIVCCYSTNVLLGHRLPTRPCNNQLLCHHLTTPSPPGIGSALHGPLSLCLVYPHAQIRRPRL